MKIRKQIQRFVINSKKPSKMKQRHLKVMNDKVSKWKEEGYKVDEIEKTIEETNE